jgi:hypothetical protein
MAARDVIILDDVFEVVSRDPDGKKFDRGVQRPRQPGSAARPDDAAAQIT